MDGIPLMLFPCIYRVTSRGREALMPLQLSVPDSKVHVANMGPIWGRQDPGGPHVGPMDLAIWGVY